MTTATPSGFPFDPKPLIRPLTVYSTTPSDFAIQIPPRISPVSIRNSDIGKALMLQDLRWYDDLPWGKEKLPAGMYCLRLPVPNSNAKSFRQQSALLSHNEKPVPVALAILVMLYLKHAGKPDPLNGQWARCFETTAMGSQSVIAWVDGRLRICADWGGYALNFVWLAAARRLA